MIILRGLRDHAERMVGRTYRRIRSDPYPCTQSHCVIVLAVSGQFPMAASGQIPVAVNTADADVSSGAAPGRRPRTRTRTRAPARAPHRDQNADQAASAPSAGTGSPRWPTRTPAQAPHQADDPDQDEDAGTSSGTAPGPGRGPGRGRGRRERAPAHSGGRRRGRRGRAPHRDDDPDQDDDAGTGNGHQLGRRARPTTPTQLGATPGKKMCAFDNHGPRCRHHHHAKQAHGWKLEQNQPGYHTWTTPAGRRYTSGPIQYPI